MKERISIDVPSLLGVDADTYARADQGDRQAQKAILRAMWTRDASPKALASNLPWTHWLLRMIGSGNRQTIADVWGVVDLHRKTKRLSDAHADALDALVEQFVGPGTVDAKTAALVRTTFASGTERKVIDLFLLHDRLASGDPGVTVPEIKRGVETSEELKSSAARVFFLGVLAQYTAQGGNFPDSIKLAEEALEDCQALATDDPEFTSRLGVTATLLRQLYGFVGDARGITRMDTEYRAAMEAYANQNDA